MFTSFKRERNWDGTPLTPYQVASRKTFKKLHRAIKKSVLKENYTGMKGLPGDNTYTYMHNKTKYMVFIYRNGYGDLRFGYRTIYNEFQNKFAHFMENGYLELPDPQLLQHMFDECDIKFNVQELINLQRLR